MGRANEHGHLVLNRVLSTGIGRSREKLDIQEKNDFLKKICIIITTR